MVDIDLTLIYAFIGFRFKDLVFFDVLILGFTDYNG